MRPGIAKENPHDQEPSFVINARRPSPRHGYWTRSASGCAHRSRATLNARLWIYAHARTGTPALRLDSRGRPSHAVSVRTAEAKLGRHHEPGTEVRSPCVRVAADVYFSRLLVAELSMRRSPRRHSNIPCGCSAPLPARA